jgi:hypothetical protein
VPGLQWTLELMLGLTFILYVSIYRGIKFNHVSAVAVYIWILILVVPIMGAIMARLEYGQPLWLGLAVHRYLISCVFVLIIAKLLLKRSIEITDFERAFKILAWVNLVLCSTVVIYFDPNNFVPAEYGNLIADGGGHSNKFILPKTFILFGALYYLALGFSGQSRLNIIYAMFFLVYLLSASQARVLMLALLCAIFFIAIHSRRNQRRNKIKNLVKVIFVLVALIVLILVVNPDIIDLVLQKFSDAFLAVLGESEVSDWSANARIQQVAIVSPLVMEHIWFGTGALSQRWLGGYEGVYGYLHPSDLGFLGVLFQYGIFGLCFFLLQYVFAWGAVKHFLRHIDTLKSQAFYMACAGSLIILMITSITTGFIAYSPEQILLFVVLLRLVGLSTTLNSR